MSYLPLVHKDTDFHYDKVRLLPLKHRLVMFPASMMHSVEDYIGETPRFSISYDLIVVGSEPLKWRLRALHHGSLLLGKTLVSQAQGFKITPVFSWIKIRFSISFRT